MNLFGFEITKSGPRSSAVRSAIERRAATGPFTVSNRAAFENLFGGASLSGAHITEETAMTLSAVFAAVRVLSEDVAGLPFKLYRRTENGREEARGHSLYDVLHYRANPLMTAFTFREVMMTHLCLWGNAFAEIEIAGNGDVVALWPLVPSRVDVQSTAEQREIRYKITLPDGTVRYLMPDQVLHVPGLGFNGLSGKSPIRLHRESLGITKAAEAFGASFFGNDATPGLALKHPGTLSEPAQANLRKSMNDRHQGLGKAHRLMILEEAMEVERISLPPEDAQFIETRKYGVTDVARIYRVPPHKLADLDRATFSNIEHQSIEYVTSSLRPWLVRWEQAVRMRLLLPNERDEYYAEHVVDALLRGDIQSRYEAYAQGRQWGWLSADEIRAKENMNELPGAAGETYLQPMNMVPAGVNPMADDEDRAALRDQETRRETRATPPPRYYLARSFRPILRDVIARATRREVAEIGRAVDRYLIGRDVEGFREWLEEFEQDQRAWMLPRMQPVYQAIAEQMSRAAEDEIGEAPDAEAMQQFARDYADAYSGRHAGSTKGQLVDLIENAPEDERAAAINQRLSEWSGDEDNPARADKEADWEQHRAMNAFTKAAWVTVGVTAHVWRTTGAETCPLCESLAGKRVSMSEWFVPAGEEVNGGAETLRVYSNLGHPPLHRGCDCYTAPSTGGRSKLAPVEVRNLHRQIIEA